MIISWVFFLNNIFFIFSIFFFIFYFLFFLFLLFLFVWLAAMGHHISPIFDVQIIEFLLNIVFGMYPTSKWYTFEKLFSLNRRYSRHNQEQGLLKAIILILIIITLMGEWGANVLFRWVKTGFIKTGGTFVPTVLKRGWR